MKITMIRHGKTDYNIDGKIQGRINIPLSDSGRREVKRLKYKIKDTSFDVCFSSPLIRTVETAMILVGDRVEIKIDDRLIERNMGNMEGKLYKDYDGVAHWDYNLNLSDNGIEPVQDILKRTEDFVNYLKENYSDKNILIVSHSATIRALHHILNNTDLNSNLTNFTVSHDRIETIII